MSIYAIGDIHGCFKSLTTLFKDHEYKTDDTFVFLGDYIDRGPGSKQVLDWLIDFSKKTNSVFIQGNHEILMLSAQNNEDRLLEWINFGGNKTLNSFKAKPEENWSHKIDAVYWKFLSRTEPYHQIDNFIFVHAGIDLENQNKHNLFWKKQEIPSRFSDTQKVICGHTSRKNGEIADFGHTICIDAYAYGGQWLTLLNVNTGEYKQTNENRKIKRGQLLTR